MKQHPLGVLLLFFCVWNEVRGRDAELSWGCVCGGWVTEERCVWGDWLGDDEVMVRG